MLDYTNASVLRKRFHYYSVNPAFISMPAVANRKADRPVRSLVSPEHDLGDGQFKVRELADDFGLLPYLMQPFYSALRRHGLIL